MSPSRLRNTGLHLLAVLGFGTICAVGSLRPELGGGLLLLFAVVSTVRMMLRNKWMLLLVLGLVALSIAFPPLAPIATVVAIYLFIKRVAFLLQHIKLILLGIFAYGAAVGLMLTGLAGVSAAVVLEPALAPALPFAVPIVGAVGALCLDLVLRACNAMGYSTGQALEIMSLIPVLLLSLVLPFLKLDFGLHPEVAPDAVMGAKFGTVDTIAVAKGGAMAKVGHYEMGFAKAATAAKPVMMKPVVVKPVVVPQYGLAEPHAVYEPPHLDVHAHAHAPSATPDVPHVHVSVHDSQGQVEYTLHHEPGRVVLQDHLGRPGYVLKSFGGKQVVENGSGVAKHYVQQSGDRHFVTDELMRHQSQLVRLGSDLHYQDTFGRTLYTARVLGPKVQVFNSAGQWVRDVSQPTLGGVEMFAGLKGVVL